jgi:cation-transporting ATPase 13A2
MQYEVTPKDSYKITEGNVFSKYVNNEDKNVENRYKLIIIKRFEFSSKFQSNSVIVRNNLDNTYRFFVKGAPEKIIEICNPESLPNNFSDNLFEHTQNGYRVLACATQEIPPDDYRSFENRSQFERGLTFLGLVVFKNKLKRDTKQIITKLKDSHIKLIMATGDNPFTSISVAQECGLIDNNKEIFFCNVEKEKDEEKLKWYNVNIRKDNFYQKFPFQEKLSGPRNISLRGISFFII